MLNEIKNVTIRYAVCSVNKLTRPNWWSHNVTRSWFDVRLNVKSWICKHAYYKTVAGLQWYQAINMCNLFQFSSNKLQIGNFSPHQWQHIIIQSQHFIETCAGFFWHYLPRTFALGRLSDSIRPGTSTDPSCRLQRRSAVGRVVCIPWPNASRCQPLAGLWLPTWTAVRRLDTFQVYCQ